MKYPILTVVLVIVLMALALAGCAAPGQPPNAGNTLVGLSVTLGGDAAIAAGVNRLNAAYTAGKVTATQYKALYAMAVKAQADVSALGNAIAQNQPVTQAQVDAAIAEFLIPLVQFVPSMPPPVAATQP
jgi:hypothetical protein